MACAARHPRPRPDDSVGTWLEPITTWLFKYPPRVFARGDLVMAPVLPVMLVAAGAVLVLIIVVLVIAQTQRINGRTPEELRRAEDYLRMLKSKKEFAVKYAGINEKLEELKKY